MKCSYSCMHNYEVGRVKRVHSHVAILTSSSAVAVGERDKTASVCH